MLLLLNLFVLLILWFVLFSVFLLLALLVVFNFLFLFLFFQLFDTWDSCLQRVLGFSRPIYRLCLCVNIWQVVFLVLSLLHFGFLVLLNLLVLLIFLLLFLLQLSIAKNALNLFFGWGIRIRIILLNLLELHLLIFVVVHFDLLVDALADRHVSDHLSDWSWHGVHFGFDLLPLLTFSFVNKLNQLVPSHLLVALLLELFYEIYDVAGSCAFQDVFL